MELWYEDYLINLRGICPQLQPQIQYKYHYSMSKVCLELLLLKLVKHIKDIKGVLPHNVERLVRGACGEDQCGDEARFVTGFDNATAADCHMSKCEDMRRKKDINAM